MVVNRIHSPNDRTTPLEAEESADPTGCFDVMYWFLTGNGSLSGNHAGAPRPVQIESAAVSGSVQNLACQIEIGLSLRLEGVVDFGQRDSTGSNLCLFPRLCSCDGQCPALQSGEQGIHLAAGESETGLCQRQRQRLADGGQDTLGNRAGRRISSGCSPRYRMRWVSQARSS